MNLAVTPNNDSQSELPAVLSTNVDQLWYRSLPLWVVLTGFAMAIATLWNNGFSVAMADGIAYITGGLNLVNTGQFLNPYGEYETWFPPLYPALIGLVSVGGRFEPVAVARLICAVSSLMGLVLIWRATLVGTRGQSTAAWLASAVLAGNAMYQTYAMAVMSHATATLCVLAAFVIWLKIASTATVRQLILLGAFIGAGFLVRPEVLLTLPLWLLIDAFALPWRETCRRFVFTGLACSAFVLPYAVYQHHITGQWQLSDKGEVTVAIGRSMFYGGPREHIDPETLELEYNTFAVTPGTELRRYGFNVVRMFHVASRTLRGPVGAGLVLASLIGCWRLVAERRWRFLFGLLAQLAFLAAVAVTWCEDRMLHAVWPVFAVLAGIGGEALIALSGGRAIHRQGMRSVATSGTHANASTQNVPRGRPLWIQVLAWIVLVWATVGWLEGATRQPRWSLADGVGRKALLRDAGTAFRAKTAGKTRGAMYEQGATVGYYAGQYRRPLPATTDLNTLVRYAQRRDTPARSAWLALWTGEAAGYHPSIRQPFLADTLPLTKVFERRLGKDRITIYEIPPASIPISTPENSI